MKLSKYADELDDLLESSNKDNLEDELNKITPDDLDKELTADDLDKELTAIPDEDPDELTQLLDSFTEEENTFTNDLTDKVLNQAWELMTRNPNLDPIYLYYTPYSNDGYHGNMIAAKTQPEGFTLAYPKKLNFYAQRSDIEKQIKTLIQKLPIYTKQSQTKASLNQLTILANHLDEKGFSKQADKLDSIIKQLNA